MVTQKCSNWLPASGAVRLCGALSLGTPGVPGRWFRTGLDPGTLPPGHVALTADILGCRDLGEEGCCWHPVGRGQGCCSTSCSAGTAAPQPRPHTPSSGEVSHPKR